jgi:hypothetical protein
MTRAAGSAGVQFIPIGCRLAVQGLGKPHGGEALSNRRFTVEEIRMSETSTGNGRPKRGNLMLVADNVAERHL